MAKGNERNADFLVDLQAKGKTVNAKRVQYHPLSAPPFVFLIGAEINEPSAKVFLCVVLKKIHETTWL